MAEEKKEKLHEKDKSQKSSEVNDVDVLFKTLTEEIERLKKELGTYRDKAEIAESKLMTALSQYNRLQADFDNFRRRTKDKEAKMEDDVKAKVLKSFLPVVDNFEMALVHVQKSGVSDTYVKGMELLLKQFITFLKDADVVEMEAQGKPFDPHFHEAVMQITSDEWDDDTVSMVMKKGYMYKDQVLRPASVQVSHKS
jgi:hypothetical protein